MFSVPARCAAFALGLVLTFAGAAYADTPPTPTCFYYVAGCDATYGTPNSSTTRIVEVDAEVTLDTGYNPDPPFGTPLNPNCLVPGSFTQCVYSNVAWLFSAELGFFTPPYAILEGCAGNNTSCRFRFSPRGIGDGGDVWQTLVAAHRVGTTTIKEKKGYAIYARPKFRWVNVNATGAVNFKAGVAYAVRSGTTPTYASCINGATINATSSTSFNCVKVTGSAGSGQNPSWKFALPSSSGGWTLYIDPVTRAEAGPSSSPGQRWPTRAISVAHSDITETISPLPQGTLTVTLDTGGSTIQKGTSRVITTTASVVGGQAPYDNVNWQVDFFGSTGLSGGFPKLVDPITDPGTKTLLPGETSMASKTLSAPSAPGSATITSKVYFSSRASGGQSVAATPVKVDAVTTPVPPPPPPPPNGTGTVPKPPIPTAATPSSITGGVADAPLTSYVVTWYAAASCDASDATARLVATTTVPTDGAGNGDASATPNPAPAGGEAVFGYSTLNGARSNRSACVTTTAPAGAGADPLVPIAGAVLPIAKPPTLKLTLPRGGVRKGRRARLKVKVGGATAGGTVVLRRGKQKLASGKVIKGVATLKVKLTTTGKLKLTLVFTPAGGGTPTVKAVTLRVT